MDDHDDHAGSLWEQLQAEAVGPLHLELPDHDELVSWTIRCVDSDGLIDLDPDDGPVDVIDALLGEDLADDVLDVLEPLDWSETVATARRLREHFAVPAEVTGQLWAWIVEQIDCYGEAIESDLAQHAGVDLLDWFRGRRPWPQLARMIVRLPQGCRYQAAILDDEELARERLSRDDEPPRSDRPALVGETQAMQLARATVSALLRIEHAVYASQAPKGKRGKPPQGLKGPETAEDRIREEIGDAEVDDIFDQVIPGWRGDQDQPPPSGFQRSGSGLLVPET